MTPVGDAADPDPGLADPDAADPAAAAGSPGSRRCRGSDPRARALGCLLDYAVHQAHVRGRMPAEVLQAVAAAIGVRLPALHRYAPDLTAGHRTALYRIPLAGALAGRVVAALGIAQPAAARRTGLRRPDRRPARRPRTGARRRWPHRGRAAGTDAHVIMGPTPQQWRSILADHRARCRDEYPEPLWDTPELTQAELRYLAQEPTWWKARAGAAWVASGLLRRIALFHTVTKPFCVRYWQHGLGWKFELRHEHGVPVDHDAVIERLTHPKWGMTMGVKRESCACKPCNCDGGAERSCWFTLSPKSDHGEAVIHFRRAKAGYDLSNVYGRLVAAGAEPSWLELALPDHHGRSVQSPGA